MNKKLSLWILTQHSIKKHSDFTKTSNTTAAEYYNRSIKDERFDTQLINIKMINRVFKEGGRLFASTNLGTVLPAPDIIINTSIPNRPQFIIQNMEFVFKNTVFINPSDSIQLCNDKNHTVSFMESLGHSQPKTFLVNSLTDLDSIINELGFPMIIKRLHGISGNDVLKISNRNDLFDIVTFSLSKDRKSVGNHPLLIQECIKGSNGKDVRVLIIGGEYAGSLMRYTEDGYFKSNYSSKKGDGKVKLYEPKEELIEASLKVTKQLRLDIAAIDFLFTEHKGEFIICEVNASPGLEGFKKVHPEIDIPGSLLDHAYRKWEKENFNLSSPS